MGSNKGKNFASQCKSILFKISANVVTQETLPLLTSIHANELKEIHHTDEIAQIAKILQFLRMLPSSLKLRSYPCNMLSKLR